MVNSQSPYFIVFIIVEQQILLKSPLTYCVYHLMSEILIVLALIAPTRVPQAYRVYHY